MGFRTREIAGTAPEAGCGEMGVWIPRAGPDAAHHLLLLPVPGLHLTNCPGKEARWSGTAELGCDLGQTIVGRRLMRIQVEGAQHLVARLRRSAPLLEQQTELEAGGGVLRRATDGPAE